MMRVGTRVAWVVGPPEEEEGPPPAGAARATVLMAGLCSIACSCTCVAGLTVVAPDEVPAAVCTAPDTCKHEPMR